ncbi:DinB family protein [Streptomyces sp. NBC_00083]|uniref:DinB family protein n=1 Tax=Streptomyces sp. NBC_00083 TaxID=2975647 RepID=UPI00225AFEEB|nr:DinB family protein [Streptomyces sp. NBC_00083]MCX5383715.1 DinB family protein [Streptomyces sp. NBC_00083]
MTTSEVPSAATARRDEPALDAAERDMLEGWLDYHRETLLQKCSGLTDEQVKRTAVPSSALTLLGLLRHLAEVERWWFVSVFAGGTQEGVYGTDEDPDGDFHFGPDDTHAEALVTWRREVAAAREQAAGHGLDELSVGTARNGRHFSLRWIYTHMIEEYARHNGHADLLREAIDGTTGS